MFDQLNCFTLQSDGTLFQTLTADAASTNIIDLDVAGISLVNPSVGPFLIIRVGTVFSGSMVTCEILLETDSAEAFSTTKKQVALLGRFTQGQMTAGKLLHNVQLPVLDYQRYLRLYFVTWTDPSGGTIFGGLADGPETPETDLDNLQAAS